MEAQDRGEYSYPAFRIVEELQRSEKPGEVTPAWSGLQSKVGRSVHVNE